MRLADFRPATSVDLGRIEIMQWPRLHEVF